MSAPTIALPVAHREKHTHHPHVGIQDPGGVNSDFHRVHAPQALHSDDISRILQQAIAAKAPKHQHEAETESLPQPQPPPEKDLVAASFFGGQSHWIDEPIISKWRNPNPKLLCLLKVVEGLRRKWQNQEPRPFDPFFDPVWLEAGRVLHDAGLPWYNNGINMPSEIDTSWPFQFKHYEQQVVLVKGRRVAPSQSDLTGYVTGWAEGNWYCIRALKQESSLQHPTQRPVLLSGRLDESVMKSAAMYFGLEWHKLSCLEDGAMNAILDEVARVTSEGQRPIIFAATLCDGEGKGDDMAVINGVSKRFRRVYLHVDASRVFDHITTASDASCRELGLPRLRLRTSHEQGLCGLTTTTTGCVEGGEIMADTFVAGGSNAFIHPAPVVALKPKLLGNQAPVMVEYVRGTDGTLSGSRDSLAPLMLFLQEERFGEAGLRNVYEDCALRCKMLIDGLRDMGISFHVNWLSFDVQITAAEEGPTNQSSSSQSLARALENLGAKPLGGGKFLVTVQPSTKPADISSLLGLLSRHTGTQPPAAPPTKSSPLTISPLTAADRHGSISDNVVGMIRNTVQRLKVASRYSGGYPLNQASYSVMGPVIGHFLSLRIPDDWVRAEGQMILEQRKRKFGLVTRESRDQFQSLFTSGSTMGNRLGIHAALARHPKAFVMCSTASHYSVRKALWDCDDAAAAAGNESRSSRFVEVQADEYGCMIPDDLVGKVRACRAQCESRTGGKTFELILFVNFGTTFTGGRDDLPVLRERLSQIGVVPVYTHVDGALDFGFSTDGVRLGPPPGDAGGVHPHTIDGFPVVQGVTLSHHKALGTMVSGEVIFYNASSETAAGSPATKDAVSPISIPSCDEVSPQAVFETWLFQQAYSEEDMLRARAYCLENANKLRQSLSSNGVPARWNDYCNTTMLERPAPWLLEEFHLAPEGGWVHYITMQHISPSAVDHFVRTLRSVQLECEAALIHVQPLVEWCISSGSGRSSSSSSSGSHCSQQAAASSSTLKRITSRSAYAESMLRCLEQYQQAPPSNAHVRAVQAALVPDGTTSNSRDRLRRRFVYSTVSFVAQDEQGEPAVVFLAEARNSRVIKPHMVLVRSSLDADICMPLLRDVAVQLYGHLARVLGASLEVGELSYHTTLFSVPP